MFHDFLFSCSLFFNGMAVGSVCTIAIGTVAYVFLSGINLWESK